MNRFRRYSYEFAVKCMVCLCMLVYSGTAFTQENSDDEGFLKKLKISGYIQAQFQHGQKDAVLNIGGDNEHAENSFNRFGIRRGRLKFTYEERILSAVFQIDLTEEGLSLKDAYLNIQDPWTKSNALRAGVFNRPFGFEIAYSSSSRESPERSTVFQMLFPDERDLGGMLLLQPPSKSPLNFIALEAGLFAGNGIQPEVDSRMDFIGHLSAVNSIGNNFDFGIGFSYYNGGVYQGTENIYRMEDKSFTVSSHPDNKGKYAKREYFGFDLQTSLKTIIGTSHLRGEYLFGQQPGRENLTESPNGGLPDFDTYVRDFSGGYVMFVIDISAIPVSLVFKYDWYNPNVKVSKNEVGINGTGFNDLLQYTFGVGALWYILPSLRLQAYYDFNHYEKSHNIPNLNNIKSDVFTLRLQYKF